jgi:hypothetical protein
LEAVPVHMLWNAKVVETDDVSIDVIMYRASTSHLYTFLQESIGSGLNLAYVQ